MFEKSKPALPGLHRALDDRNGIDEALSRMMTAGAGTGATNHSLREMDWGELTARMNAVRDLRRVLVDEEDKAVNLSASHFARAANRYLEARGDGNSAGGEHGERGINSLDLDGGKASPDKESLAGRFEMIDPGERDRRQEATRETSDD